MAEAGQEMASHTVNHLNLTTLSDEDLQYELEEAKKLIEEKTGVPVISVCYPAGKYDDLVMAESDKFYLFGRTTQPFDIIDWEDRFDIGTVRMFPTTNPSVVE
jgi:peptidoglycan/xylan/chitin deacetylase (PgdA/CDA1 family)